MNSHNTLRFFASADRIARSAPEAAQERTHTQLIDDLAASLKSEPSKVCVLSDCATKANDDDDDES